MQKEVMTYLRARYPLVYIVSAEEERVCAALAGVAEAMNMKLHLWSVATGLDNDMAVADPMGVLTAIGSTDERALYVLRDYHPFLEDSNPANVPQIRMLRELRIRLAGSRPESMRAVVILAGKLALPAELAAEVAVLNWPLPTEPELREALDQVVVALGDKVNGTADREAIVRAAKGLTMVEAQNCFARSLIQTRSLDPDLIKAEKKQAVTRSGAVEWIEPIGGMEIVGGLENVKAWAERRGKAFGEKARAYGLPKPKGLLVVGVSGCGKSLLCGAIAALWRVPHLRVMADALAGGLVGESEAKTRKVLELASATGGVLQFDEVEKLFAGAKGDGAADSGVGKKVLSMVLTWMQEQQGVFCCMTANDVRSLPSELLRKGRLDEIFFVDLPTPAEREAIWRIQLQRRSRKPEAFDIARLVQASDLRNGAEIEAAVIDGMFAAFDQDEEVTTEHILEALATSVPFAKMAAEDVKSIREWAAGRAVNASLAPKAAKEDRFAGLEL